MTFYKWLFSLNAINKINGLQLVGACMGRIILSAYNNKKFKFIVFSLWCVKPALVLYMWLEINLHVVSIIQMLEAWKVPVSAHVCIFVMYNIKWPDLRKLTGGSKMSSCRTYKSTVLFCVDKLNNEWFYIFRHALYIYWCRGQYFLKCNQKDEKDVGDRTPHHSGV